MQVHVDTTIERPVEDVFEQLIRLSDYPRWLAPSLVFTSCRQTSAGPIGTGTSYEDVTKLGTLEGEVSDFPAPSRVTFHETLRWLGRSIFDLKMEYVLRPDGAGRTEVHHVAEGELKGAFRVAGPILELVARRERQRTIAALKRSLEAPKGESAGRRLSDA